MIVFKFSCSMLSVSHKHRFEYAILPLVEILLIHQQIKNGVQRLYPEGSHNGS